MSATESNYRVFRFQPPAESDSSSLTTWVDVNVRNSDGQKWLTDQRDIPEAVLEALMAENTRPRFMGYAHGFCLVLRGVNLNDGEDVEDMISLRVWASEHRVISCHRRHLRTIDDAMDRVEGGAITNLSQLFEYLVERLIQRIDQSVISAEHQLDQMEHQNGQELTVDQEQQLNELRSQSITMLRYLIPQREAVDKVIKVTNPPFAMPNLSNAYDTAVRAIEDLQLIREQSMATLDAHYAALAREQNNRLFVLSIVAAIFLPLTFVTGLLGMNVADIPGANFPGAFWWIVGLSTAGAGVLWLLFKRGRWL